MLLHVEIELLGNFSNTRSEAWPAVGDTKLFEPGVNVTCEPRIATGTPSCFQPWLRSRPPWKRSPYRCAIGSAPRWPRPPVNPW